MRSVAVTGQLTMKQLNDEQQRDPLILYAHKCLACGTWWKHDELTLRRRNFGIVEIVSFLAPKASYISEASTPRLR